MNTYRRRLMTQENKNSNDNSSDSTNNVESEEQS